MMKVNSKNIDVEIPFEVDENDMFVNEEKEMRVVSLRELKELNKISIKKDYNKNVYVGQVINQIKKEMRASDIHGVWSGLDTNVLLIPIMVHRHTHGLECEPHIRCRISASTIIEGLLLLDIPIEDFSNCITFDRYQKAVQMYEFDEDGNVVRFLEEVA